MMYTVPAHESGDPFIARDYEFFARYAIDRLETPLLYIEEVQRVQEILSRHNGSQERFLAAMKEVLLERES